MKILAFCLTLWSKSVEKRQEEIHDPAFNPKGRPRWKRMTETTEGRPRGGEVGNPGNPVINLGEKMLAPN